ncbi:MauE/DoxX family redox-associated membrane protein [Paenibacillus sp. NPDC057967]|uniref:MauE/DoxX family redox-associated membrane protein n=1 Tax=Paenibacillus sp. NPDC057967 TaxID=3346293 RepID=UPI0036DB15CB
MHLLAYLTDMLLAGMFFLAAFSKLGSSFADFRLSITSYRVLPRSFLTPAAGIVLAAELGLVVLYGFGLLPIWRDLLAVLLFAGFTIMLFRKRRLQESEDTSCSCFGKIEVLNKYPVMRNVVLMLLAGGRLALPDRATADLDAAVLALTGLTVIISGTMLLELYSSLRRSKEIRIDL